MVKLLKDHKYFWLLFATYLLGEFIVRPLGNFPLNDDWSYAKSVVKLCEEGKIDIGDWPAMTLATHLVWGALFVKILGFSFISLRISTWVSMLIGMWVLQKLAYRMSGNKTIAFITCLTLLFNPIYFNNTNTFMTDVNFITMVTMVCYFAYDFFTTGKNSSFIVFFVLSLLLVLLRQYGIIAPACMTITCMFLHHKKKMYATAAVFMTVVIFLIFKEYEAYLQSILPANSSYKFSANINPTRRLFWDYLLYGITTRYKIVTIHAMFYAFPLSIIFLPSIIRQTNRWLLLGITIITGAVVYLLYLDYPLQVGNVFLDTAVGVDTTYETLKGTYVGAPHFFSALFEKIMTPFKYILITSSLVCTICFLIRVFQLGKHHIHKKPEILFLLLLFFSYVMMILITESFFDRYLLPVILLSALVFTYLSRVFSISPKLAVVPILALFYISVFGTYDYFRWNEKKWDAYYDLVEKEKVDPQLIDGGFEINCWNDGKPSVWYKFVYLDNYDYLIQYKNEEDFALMKEYPYQRLFPFKMDTMRVFKRISVKRR